ncbi:polysaccharide export protein [Pedobacter frigidisoli]|uniref:Polysaccharide export protein n=1 Tax=Pedobacter frigidisoli TaxID=2530455 RepID=A0A4R0NSB1_9SPHI|nr:polysaccharide biosynthesis/export family protein [Pedobacter frigidisoli]TCD01974.1 polysaccharide export protein [Pedobacter frigidisoli]
MKKTLQTLLSVYAVTLIFSCGSYKKIPYFQDLNPTTPLNEQISNYVPLLVQPGDNLGINVSSRNPESSSVFNYNLNRANGNNFDNSAENPVTGYLVDEKGDIHLPLLGNQKAAGLTTSQLREQISKKLETFYKDPVVNIRILNFKVAIFGDVQRPGVYAVQNERATITQALTLAGDLNITAVRNITLIREENGKRSFIPIDLKSKKIFESPYYYLKNNDEIYVQPDRTKYATVDRGYRTATLVLSGLSIIAIVLSNLYR